MKKRISISILWVITLNAYTLYAQDRATPTIEKEVWVEIDSIYQKFSQAYRSLNSNLLSECYLDNAISISLYNGQLPKIVYGKEAIAASLANFLNYIKKENEAMSISFKIIKRSKNDKKVFDIGYYKLVIQKEGKDIETDFGKIAIVLTKDTGGHWKYETDTNSSATATEFEKAVVAAYQ